ncbi:MAG: intermembrane transport protein PqiB [Candidatus Binataceae bacterium]
MVWIIPIIAAALGVWVAVNRILSEGPALTIVFQSADGLEAGKTKIRYKGVDVGTITKFRLSADHHQVIATAAMAPETGDFFVQDTQFWVVRPRISGANVTGLGTLISGAYIGMEIGSLKMPKYRFVALETPPVISSDVPGRYYVLKASDLGSLDDGTPVFFRRLQVGRVASYALNSSGQYFAVKIFIKAPYDQFVTPDSRFWEASGIDMQLSANGLSVQTQSLLSIMIGGIAFETPDSSETEASAQANSAFTLYANHAQAFEPPSRNPQTYELVFNESVRGLSPGAPVELRGIKVGEVADIRAQMNVKTSTFSVPVTIHLDPQRLGVRMLDLKRGTGLSAVREKLIDALVAHGVRAQLRTGNLLTGSAFVAFDFFPDARPVKIDWSQHPVQLPTVPGQLEATEARINNIVNKFNSLPLKQIADNLNKTLGDLDLTLISARGTLDTANTMVTPSSVQRTEIDQTLQEVRRAARSIRVLADFLERHPETLLRGKKGEPK